MFYPTVYSSQALTKPSGLPELSVGLVGHGVHAGAVEHRTVDRLLVCFIRSLGSVRDSGLRLATGHPQSTLVVTFESTADVRLGCC